MFGVTCTGCQPLLPACKHLLVLDNGSNGTFDFLSYDSSPFNQGDHPCSYFHSCMIPSGLQFCDGAIRVPLGNVDDSH